MELIAKLFFVIMNEVKVLKSLKMQIHSNAQNDIFVEIKVMHLLLLISSRFSS